MTILEAIHNRHSVRKYTDKPIPQELIDKLNDKINQINVKYDLNIVLKVNDDNAFNLFFKLILAKGIKNYLILCGEDRPDLDEKLGYCGADIMLYAQTLGLNTWWAGSTFNKKDLSKIADGNRVTGVISIGYGATQGIPHKSKQPEEVSFYEGETPEWFKNGVSAALLAPTAKNKQSFVITGNGVKVSISCDNGVFTGSDLGLVKYHFEIGAGKENFSWQ